MIRGLTQVPWERVDVSFRKSRQKYIAHNTIQVSDRNELQHQLPCITHTCELEGALHMRGGGVWKIYSTSMN